MENITVQSRITPELKEASEHILNAMGLKTSEAIRLFLHQVVNSKGLPFRPSVRHVPNSVTKESFIEMQEGKFSTSSLCDFKKEQEEIDD